MNSELLSSTEDRIKRTHALIYNMIHIIHIVCPESIVFGNFVDSFRKNKMLSESINIFIHCSKGCFEFEINLLLRHLFYYCYTISEVISDDKVKLILFDLKDSSISVAFNLSTKINIFQPGSMSMMFIDQLKKELIEII